MSKAARRRKARNKVELVKLYQNSPEEFEAHWEMRLESWLSEARVRAREWYSGYRTYVGAPSALLDEALETLRACGKEAYRRFAPLTCELLDHECSKEVAERNDRRLYRLSRVTEVFTGVETPQRFEGQPSAARKKKGGK